MRFLIFGDVHWSTYGSIVRSRGDKYSTRLEYLISSMNWVEKLAQTNECDSIIGLGDFFDHSELSAEEISALSEISWSDITHYFIVGNHEMGNSSLSISSSHLFNLKDKATIITTPSSQMYEDVEVVYLPYILETDRKALSEYLSQARTSQRIIIAHNDIAGMQLGKYTSVSGFKIEEIENNCDLFINGHLHNGTFIGKSILNLGNLCGQNFSEDASQYPHRVLLLDTSNRSLEFIENPYALNFYKLDYTSCTDQEILDSLGGLKKNAVITIKCSENQCQYIKDILANNSNIIAQRLIVDIIQKKEYNTDIHQMSIDHISKFNEYIKSTLGTDDLIADELFKISN